MATATATVPTLDLPYIPYFYNPTAFPVQDFPIKLIPLEGAEQGAELYQITIPRGTLLYHSADIPKETGDRLSYLVKLLKGATPYGTKVEQVGDQIRLSGCLDQANLRYFFSNPIPAMYFAEGSQNNYLLEYETREDIPLAILMTPSKYHKHNDEKDVKSIASILKNCSQMFKKISEEGISLCSTAKLAFNPYDKCFTSEFLLEKNLNGHIAISYEEAGHLLRDYESISLGNADNNYPDLLAKLKILLNIGTYSEDIWDLKRDQKKIGPVEIVLHQFGQKGLAAPVNFDYSIPIETGGPEQTLIRHLISGSAIFPSLIQIRSLIFPEKIIDFKTRRQGPLYQIQETSQQANKNISFLYNGEKYQKQVYYKRQRQFTFFLNFLLKFQDFEKSVFVEPRTGFLMSAFSAPRMSNGQCFREFAFGPEPPLTFSGSVKFRLENKFRGLALQPRPKKDFRDYNPLIGNLLDFSVIARDSGESGGGAKTRKVRRH